MDYLCIPGAYGVVTMPFSVREGINIFLSGFVPTENLRFREEALTFKVAPTLFASQIQGGGTRGKAEGTPHIRSHVPTSSFQAQVPARYMQCPQKSLTPR